MGFGTGNLGMGITFSMTNNASGPAKAAGNSMMTLSQKVDKAGTQIVNNSNKIISGLVGVSIVVSALLGPFVGVTKAAAEFDAVMSELSAKANLDKASKQMATLTAQSIALGDATKFSAKEVGQGQVFLAQAGFKSNQILKSMPGLLSLAAAGNLDLASTADIASNILTAMSIPAAGMGRVADVLASAATSANVSVRQMGESFKFAAGPAKLLGFSLEQTAALVGLLGNMGIQGSLAGTSIQNMAAFISKMDDKKLGMVGLRMADITDSRGDLLSIQTVMNKILGSVSKFGNVKQLNILNKLFGLRGGKGGFAIQKSFEGIGLSFDDFVLKLEGAAGAAEVMAKKMLDNLAGDMVKFKGVLETTAIVAGGGLAEAMRPVVQMSIAFLKVIKQFLATPFGQWFIKVAAAVAVFTASLIVLGFIATVVAPALWGMVTAGAALVVTFAPFILIAAAVGAGIMLMVKSYKEFTKLLEGGEVKTGFMGFMQRLGAVMQAGVMIWKSWNGETFTLTENMHASLVKLGLLDFVLTMGTYIVRIKEFFKGFRDGLLEMWALVGPIWDGLKDSFQELLNTFDLGTIRFGKWSADLGDVGEAGKVLGFILTGLVVGPLTALLTVVDLIVQGLTFMVDLFKDFTELGQAGLDGGLVGLMMKVAQNADSGEAGLVSTLVGKVTNAIVGTDVIPFRKEVNNNLGFAEVPGTNPFFPAQAAAENRAASVPANVGPVVIDKTVTTQGNVTVVNQIDSEEVGRKVFEKQTLDDNRQ